MSDIIKKECEELLEYGDGYFSVKRSDGWTMENANGAWDMADAATSAALDHMSNLERRLQESEAGAAVMRDVLKAYEKWESDLVMSGPAWGQGLPRFTQELYDSWMLTQAKRNAAFSSSAGRELLGHLDQANDALREVRAELAKAGIDQPFAHDGVRELLARLEKDERSQETGKMSGVFWAGYRKALEDAARAAEEEERLYAESVREQDAQGSYAIGTAESRAVLACRSVAAAIRALANPKPSEPERVFECCICRERYFPPDTRCGCS